jgi:hypothetical protein
MTVGGREMRAHSTPMLMMAVLAAACSLGRYQPVGWPAACVKNRIDLSGCRSPRGIVMRKAPNLFPIHFIER